MKVIELEQESPTLDQVIDWAAEETVVLRRQGLLFAITPIDDFANEVEALRRNPEFLEFLEELSQEEKGISLDDLRKELAI